MSSDYVLAAAAFAYVSFRSVLFLRQRPTNSRLRKFAFLALLVATIGAMLQLLANQRTLSYSREFVALTGEGVLGWLGMLALLLGAALIAGWSLYLARANSATQPRGYLAWLIGGVVTAIFVLLVLSIRPLNPTAPDDLVVYAFDSWWPLLTWLGLCATEVAFAVVGVGGFWKRAAVLPIIVISLIALSRPLVSDRSTNAWYWLLALTIIVGAGITGWLAGESAVSAGRNLTQMHKLLVVSVSAASAAAAIWLGAFWPLCISVGVPLAVGLWPFTRFGGGRAPLTPASTDQHVALAQLAMVTVLPLLFVSDSLPAAGTKGVLVFAVSFALVVDLRLRGLLLTLPSAAAKIGHSAKAFAGKLMFGVQRTTSRVWPAIDACLKVLSNATTSLAVLTWLLVIAFAAILLWNEARNAGRTLVEPFQVNVVPELSPSLVEGKDAPSLSANHGKAFAEQLTHELFEVGRRTRLPHTLPEASNPAGAALPVFSQDVDVTLIAPERRKFDSGGDESLQLGSTRVPLAVVLEPVRGLLQSLLRVRVITGALVLRKGTAHALAFSNRGESWSVGPVDVGEDEVKAGDAVATLSRQLAFSIYQGSLATRPAASWGAYQSFVQGLDAIGEVEDGDRSKLSGAIESFRKSVALDPSFAQAHLRLGLTLRLNSQPESAAVALRNAVATDRDLAAAANVLAYHLFFYERSLPPAPATDRGRSPADPVVVEQRRSEARALWYQVVLGTHPANGAVEIAAAYYGLCLDASSSNNLLLAFHFCRRAESLYERLAALPSANPRLRHSSALVQLALGDILFESLLFDTFDQAAEWSCAPLANPNDKTLAVYNRPYAISASRYYMRVQERLHTDTRLRCRMAAARAVLGEWAPMRNLMGDPAIRTQTAAARSKAGLNALYPESERLFRAAIEEYGKALSVAPNHLPALNGHAFTFWVWRLRSAAFQPPPGPEPEIAHAAEANARRALVLSSTLQNPLQKAVSLSTLGEVLLAQSRTQEAVEVLTEAVRLSPDEAYFDEVRWELAQAFLCEAEKAERTKQPRTSIDPLVDKAEDLLQGMRSAEELRDTQPYSDAGLLDSATYQRVCAGDPAFAVERYPRSNGPTLILLAQDAQGYAPCNRSGVLIRLDDQAARPAPQVWAHVWGGGIEVRAPLGQPIRLGDNARTTTDYYFVQLERQSATGPYETLSSVTPIPTFGDDGGQPCSRNRTVMVFGRKR